MPRRSCRRQATADMTGSDTMGGGMYGSDRDGVRAAFADGAVSFWEALDALVGGAEIVVDRPRGSHHPDFPEFVYELDYGYLKGTTSADGGGDRCLDRQRSPSAGDRCALYGRSGEARRRTENSRRLYSRRLCRDPAFLLHAALGGADSAAQKAVAGCPHFRTAGFQQVNQKIFCSSSSSAQPSGVRRHSRLRPHSTNPARRKRARLAALSGATLHHS